MAKLRPAIPKVPMALSAAAFALAACAQHHAMPLKVSQRATDLHLVERVRTEALSECASDDGLRGVTWPYSSLPGSDSGLDYSAWGLAAEISIFSKQNPTPAPPRGMTTEQLNALQRATAPIIHNGPAPLSGMLPFVADTPPPPSSIDEDQRRAAVVMLDLTRNAPRSYLYGADLVGTHGAKEAIFTCNDGVQFSSSGFTFLP